MNRLLRSLVVAGALACALSACATYDYGYGYAQPYSYGYAAPYAYDYGYAYDDPYYGYSPGYYVVPPAVGFDFRYRDRDHRDRGHFDRDHRGAWNGDHRMSSNWNPDRRTSSNRNTRQSATASSVNSSMQQGRIRAMQATASNRGASASPRSRIAPAPLDSQRAQATPPAPRPEGHAEQRG